MNNEVLIIGGGLNGPALALALASGGIAVRVLDAAPVTKLRDPEFDGRAYALSISSISMLKALGIWARVEEHAQEIRDIKVSDGHAGEGASPLFLHFDHREIEEGPMGHLVEDRYLRAALLDAIAQSNLITHETDIRVTGQEVTPSGATAILENAETRVGSMLIGCDGRNSQTAARAGIKRSVRDYSQTSLVAAIKHELPHNSIAHQFFMPAGPLAILPLPGNMSSIVWTEDTQSAAHINAMDDTEYLEVLRPRFGDFLGKISLVGKRYSYPLSLSLAQHIVSKRLALVGDAAHGIHPLAGQGLNLGFRDVAALAQVVIEAKRRGEDIGASDVLERYRRWRSFDIAAMAAATDTINRVFSTDNSLIRIARDVALGAVNAAPALRRGLIRQAAGLEGDLPNLMKGQQI